MPADTPSREEEIRQLEAVIAIQRKQLEGLLPEADIAKTLAPLQAKLASLRGADASSSEQPSDGPPSVAFPLHPQLREAIRDVLATGPEGDHPSFREVLGSLRTYLSWCRQGYGNLRLHGAMVQCQRDDPRVSDLDDVFVPVRFSRAGAAGIEEAGAPLLENLELVRTRQGRAQKRSQDQDQEVRLRDLLTVGERLAVIGGAGSGKSTLVAYLAYHLATTCGREGDVPPFVLPGEAPFLVPFVVPFREYRQYRDQIGEEGDGSLAGFVPWCVERQVRRSEPKFCGQAAPLCETLLRAKCCLLLLDGLDEIASAAERPQVRAAVETLVNTTYPGNRVIVTARGSGYRDQAVFGKDFTRLDVQSLDDDETGILVGNWCRQLYPADAQAHTDGLLLAIGEMNARSTQADNRRLIGTPLLVTMVVSVEFGEAELPRERAKLYEACVKVILTAQYNTLVGDSQEVLNWGGPWDEQREWLAKLAFEMHRGGSGAAAIPEARVREILAGELSPGKLDRFIEATRYRGGLFEEKAELFQFLHLTFQEFLVARYLVKHRDEDPLPGLAPHIAEPWWREALLLLHGYAASDHPPFAGRYLGWLSRQNGNAETRLAGLELAGAALLEQEPRQTDHCRQQATALLKVLTDSAAEISGPTRGRAGNTLAALGDPRAAVMTLDGMEFCLVPKGHFWMGSADDDKDASESEKPLHEVNLAAYWLARYPVTVAQFREYVERSGQTPKDSDSLGGLSNHPIVSVSWHQAMQFCGWLTTDWQAKGLIPADWCVRLPSEAEWEKAARGGTQLPQEPECWALPLLSVPDTDFVWHCVPGCRRRFPWGDEEPDADRANYDDTGIRSTSAAGSFAMGASPYGCEEMAGNVLEWTRSLFAEYPYDPAVEAVAGKPVSDDDLLVVRGGAFWYGTSDMRCAYRRRFDPVLRNVNLGFRVVLSPFLRS